MKKITGIDGTPLSSVDRSKISVSKLRCIESKDSKGLVEAWAVGEVESADIQVWLLVQVVTLLAQLQQGSVLSPIVRH